MRPLLMTLATTLVTVPFTAAWSGEGSERSPSRTPRGIDLDKTLGRLRETVRAVRAFSARLDASVPAPGARPDRLTSPARVRALEDLESDLPVLRRQVESSFEQTTRVLRTRVAVLTRSHERQASRRNRLRSVAERLERSVNGEDDSLPSARRTRARLVALSLTRRLAARATPRPATPSSAGQIARQLLDEVEESRVRFTASLQRIEVALPRTITWLKEGKEAGRLEKVLEDELRFGRRSLPEISTALERSQDLLLALMRAHVDAMEQLYAAPKQAQSTPTEGKEP